MSLLTKAFGPSFLLGCLIPLTVFNPTLAQAAELEQRELTFYTRQINLGGVEQTSKFKEIHVRGPNDIWIERVIPDSVRELRERAEKTQGHHHKHLDTEASARWIHRDKDGNLTYFLVDRDHKIVVTIEKAELGSARMSGDWDSQYHLVSMANLKSMKKNTGASGDILYEWSDKNRKMTVAWNERHKFPTAISTDTKNGQFQEKTTVRAMAAPTVAPWDLTKKFGRAEWSDFLD